MQENEFVIPNCWACMDKGEIIYKKKNNTTGVEYEYIASCICQNSIDKQAFPPAKQFFDLNEIANRNIERIYNIYKNNPEIKQQLDNIINKVSFKSKPP